MCHFPIFPMRHSLQLISKLLKCSQVLQIQGAPSLLVLGIFMNEMYQAGFLCMYVALKFDSLSMMKQLINLNKCKLFEVHAPLLLQMRHNKESLLRSASIMSSTNCKLVVSKTKPNHSSVTMSLCDVTMDGEFFVQRAHC